MVHDKKGLSDALDRHKAEIAQKDKEIEQYQNTIVRQTRDLSQMTEQNDIIKDQNGKL